MEYVSTDMEYVSTDMEYVSTHILYHICQEEYVPTDVLPRSSPRWPVMALGLIGESIREQPKGLRCICIIP